MTVEVNRVLVTGSRDWSDAVVLSWALTRTAIDPETRLLRPDLVVVHGDCPTGADAMAQSFCEFLGVPTERHPADWSKYGRGAGPIRNQEMVDLGADLCLAFPLPGSRGTANCMKLARAAGIPVFECTLEKMDTAEFFEFFEK